MVKDVQTSNLYLIKSLKMPNSMNLVNLICNLKINNHEKSALDKIKEKNRTMC